MKVICIDNIELGKDSYGNPRNKKLALTIGQTYEVDPDVIILGKKNFYMLEKDDDGIETPLYLVSYFVTIDVWRESQLDKIL